MDKCVIYLPEYKFPEEHRAMLNYKRSPFSFPLAL